MHNNSLTVYDKPNEKKRELNKILCKIMSEIAGDAFFLGLLFNILSGEHNHPPYSGGLNSTRTHPITALPLEFIK